MSRVGTAIRSAVHGHPESARRALRCSLAVTVSFVLAHVLIDGAQAAIFASFGGFALLAFADFPGDRTARAAGFAMLVTFGTALIVVGTLVSGTLWLAVALMLVTGFAVLFAGALSAALAGAARALLLTFILPATVPADVSDLPARVGGWLIAVVVCVPAALFLFPPKDHLALRRRTAGVCVAVAELVDALLAGRDDVTPRDAARGRLAEFEAQFNSTVNRPVGTSAGSRALVRLLDELTWLVAITTATSPAVVGEWSSGVRDAVESSGRVLRASADVLTACGATATAAARSVLDSALDRSVEARRTAFDAVVVEVLRPDGPVPRFEPHGIAYAVTTVGHTVDWAAMADARPVWRRIAGAGLPDLGVRRRSLGEIAPLRESTIGLLRGSEWVRDSVRGALGLALAVGLAGALDLQHGFWVVLGALSVLRSTALSTGASALRAVGGTAVGFAIGAAFVELIDDRPVGLWLALPIAIFVAAYAPVAISFAAGQAAFTVVVLVLFNIVEPVGWKVGVTRIEDVVIGSAVSVVVGVLMWPRGAAAAVRSAVVEAYRTGAAYVADAVAIATGARSADRAVDAEESDAEAEARAAGRALDDAVRHLQVEMGGDRRQLGSLNARAAGAARLRLAGDAVVGLGPEPDGLSGMLPRARAVVESHTARIVDAARDGGDVASASAIGAEITAAIRSELAEAVAAGPLPRRLLWASARLADLEHR